MKDEQRQNRRGRPRRDASEIGRVRVFSNPGPDAEDRLRRLFALLVRYATQDESVTSGEASPADESHSEDRDEANA